jgi:alpha-methylacyl-CoA racemase
MTGPLNGIRVIEMAGMGAAPFAAMMLADAGADVLRIDRVTDVPSEADPAPRKSHLRGRRSVAIDLKNPSAKRLLIELISVADVLIEGYRPGAMEKLSLGPQECLGANPRLVYVRATGWGQTGPLAPRAGHDINYIALSGVLHMIGPAGQPPVPPVNFLGDIGGGAYIAAFGAVTGVVSSLRTGKGTVIDAAMLDGASYMATMFHGQLANGTWQDERGVNDFDGGAPWYGCYETKDGHSIAIGAYEQNFYDELLGVLGLDFEELPDRHDKAQWPALRSALAARIRTRTRAEWEKLADGKDACLSPVLSMREAADHPHNMARAAFMGDPPVPSPAPRFDGHAVDATAPTQAGAQSRSGLRDWGVAADRIERLHQVGAVMSFGSGE